MGWVAFVAGVAGLYWLVGYADRRGLDREGWGS